jgi:hypothetical protein
MNWTRGLFRLWLVLSVLWIGGVAAMTWQALPAGTFIDANPPPPGYEIEKPRADLPVAPWIEAGRAEVRAAALVAFIPPGFFLLLGAALIWAGRGFRAERN